MDLNNIACFFKNHPYLFSNIISCFVFLFLGKRFLTTINFKLMLASGLLCTIAAPFQIFYQVQYWTPTRVAGGSFGIEDVLCNFAVGVIIWFIVGCALRNDFAVDNDRKAFLKRILLTASISFLFFLILYSAAKDAMMSLVATSLAMATGLLFFKRRFFIIGLLSAVVFTLVYFLLIKLYFFIWPNFLPQWGAKGFWVRQMLGVPQGELLWAVAFGFYWSILIAFIFNIEDKKKPS